jgi:hypothetical protein
MTEVGQRFEWTGATGLLRDYSGFADDETYFACGSFVFESAEIRALLGRAMYALALTRESFSADEGFGRIANAINAFGPYDLKYRSVEGTRDIRTLWNAAVQSGSSRDMTNAIAQSDVDGFPVVICLYLQERRREDIPKDIADHIVTWILRDRVSRHLSFEMWVLAMYFCAELESRVPSPTLEAASVEKLKRGIWHDFHKYVTKYKAREGQPRLTGPHNTMKAAATERALFAHRCGWQATCQDLWNQVRRWLESTLSPAKKENKRRNDAALSGMRIAIRRLSDRLWSSAPMKPPIRPQCIPISRTVGPVAPQWPHRDLLVEETYRFIASP